MKRKPLLLFFPFFLLFLLGWGGAAWAQQETTIQIKVSGLSDVLNEKITVMLTDRVGNIPPPISEIKIERFYRQSHKMIQTALQPYGYFKPQIHSHREQVKGVWTLVYQITPGPVVKVVHVDLQITGAGVADPAFKALKQNLPVKAGQNFNVDNYEDAKNALFNLAANRGYFDAKMVLNQIILNVEHRQASIVLHFDTGQRYRFGPTLFPPSDLNLSFLERFLRYQTGDYYNSAEVQKTQQVLAGSGYFSQSVVTPTPTEGGEMEVPIKVELTPVKPRRYTFGAGYGTDTGPRGTLGFNWIPINSYGHHVNVLARGSYINTGGQTQQNSYINGSYIIPGKDPATDSYAINVGYGIINQDTGNANSFKAAVSYNTVLGPDWQQVLALTELQERYQLTGTPNINANVLYPSGHWQYIRNRAIQKEKIISRGVSASFDIAGAVKDVASETSFIQGIAGLKALATFDPTHTRFLFRSQVGRTQIDELNNLPLTLQLFAGGPTSIRGFQYNSIGPGRNLLIASGEIQQRVYKSWYLAGFLDTGTVTDSSPLTDIKQSGYKAGAGVGVVVLTPIGAVELAMARPLIIKPWLTGGKTWQLEFSVGAEL